MYADGNTCGNVQNYVNYLRYLFKREIERQRERKGQTR